MELINFFRKTDISKMEIIQLLNLKFENINFEENISELIKHQDRKKPAIILQLVHNFKDMIKDNNKKINEIVREVQLRQKK